jgi:site-specific DNA recombinase
MMSAITLIPEDGELTINLRGDLAAMLTYAANGKPARFAAGGLGVGSQVSLVAGTRSTRFLPNRGASDPFTTLLPSQESFVAGAGFTRFLLLAEREIPRLAA